MIDGLAAAASSLGDVGLGDKLLTLNSQDPNTCHCLGLSGSRSNGLEQGRGVYAVYHAGFSKMLRKMTPGVWVP